VFLLGVDQPNAQGVRSDESSGDLKELVTTRIPGIAKLARTKVFDGTEYTLLKRREQRAEPLVRQELRAPDHVSPRR
jgi:hypothetical protein